MNGGQIEQKFEGKTEEAEMLKEVPEHERYMLYGTRLSSPKLGRYYKLPERSNAYGAQPVLDSSLAYVSKKSSTKCKILCLNTKFHRTTQTCAKIM